MKSFNALIVLAILLVIGQVQSRVASGSGNSVFAPSYKEKLENSRCPHDATTNSTTILPFLLTKMEACITRSFDFLQRFIPSIYKHKTREFFQGVCAQVPSATACMDQVVAEADLCLNDMKAKAFKVSRENSQVGISSVCDDDGENVALIMEALAYELPEALICFRGLLSDERFHYEEPDLPAYIVRKYHEGQEARECALNVAREQQVATTIFDKFFDKFLGNI